MCEPVNVLGRKIEERSLTIDQISKLFGWLREE
jgi:hypothetical protein